jgi:hypothetical protein
MCRVFMLSRWLVFCCTLMLSELWSDAVLQARSSNRVTPPSGTLNTVKGAGLTMTVDSRWVDNGGYRPVFLKFTPMSPGSTIDRTLTITVVSDSNWGPRNSSVIASREVVIPRGVQPVQATLSVPQHFISDGSHLVVTELGQTIDRLSTTQGLFQSYQNTNSYWIEGLPTILFVGEEATEDQLAPMALALNFPSSEWSSTTGNQVGILPLPQSVSRPVEGLPTRWRDYSSLDLVFISHRDLNQLKQQHEPSWKALKAWVSTGGTLIVYLLEEKLASLPEIERLLDLPEGEVQPASENAGKADSGESDAGNGNAKSLNAEPVDTETNTAETDNAEANDSKAADSKASEVEGMPGQDSRWRRPNPRDYRETEFLLNLQNRYVIEQDEESLDKLKLKRPPNLEATFLYRTCGSGLIVASLVDDPLPGNYGDWCWIFNTLGTQRLFWAERHGMSLQGENPDFWDLLIPGVGLPPVIEFQILITLFAIGIGPVNYFLLRRRRKLYLLVLTVPGIAGTVTFGLIGYAIIADGFGIYVRARTYTQIDQRAGHAVCHSRLSYYAGMAPSDGLRFAGDTVVLPYTPLGPREGGPGSNNQTRTIAWNTDNSDQDRQQLDGAWLRSRTPSQLLTVRSRPSSFGLEIHMDAADGDSPATEQQPAKTASPQDATPADAQPVQDASDPPTDDESSDAATNGFSGSLQPKIRITNRLGTRIEQLVLYDAQGQAHIGASIDADATATLTLTPNQNAGQKIVSLLNRKATVVPAGAGASNTFSTRSFYYGYDTALIQAGQKDSLLEQNIMGIRQSTSTGKSSKRNTYFAVVERSPEVQFGVDEVDEEASLHVIRGTW